jgi:hypothetical protein
MARDPAVLAHQEWLGYVQPVGLVVSIPAMLNANARINANFGPEHRHFLETFLADENDEPIAKIDDFPEFAESVLGWAKADLYGSPGAPALQDTLEVPLPEYNETLRPTYALREFEPATGAREWILLVKVLPGMMDFDAVPEEDSRHWQASPQAKFERLLRRTQIPIGLLVNREQIRLVYAPDKELSGHITFKLPEMVKVAGRPIFAAFQMLLSSERLYSVGERERLPAILDNSRKYQNVVSTQLANQVLEALYELLRGFQAANDQTQGELLREVLARDPDIVYRGLLTTLLRMVFILYAEDRGLLSTDSVYTNYYSVTGLYERLRIDDGRYPDTMDQRFGAWAQLLTLFRLIYHGGSHGALRIPAREGYLFDPERYPFLEGRHGAKDAVEIPRVPDGVLFRVLSKLMLLDGERISYRTLAVEQIGSVYEAIMGFELHVADGPSIAIKPAKKHGAPTTINLEALLQTAPDKRLKSFNDQTDQKLTGTAADALKAAADINELLAALSRKIASSVTPGIVARGAMIFQPSDERRRSGSHYTPSSLTGPIVEAALAPVLKQLGDNPTPAQILNLKVCDPAMGSGAFLVEACRQLGEALSKAWHAHNEAPTLPPDEDENLHAQRQIAQRCLYGVDKNPMATDLAKLSLWLATLAKDHPFTFLDHSLRAGDSLVGLTRKQTAAFHWEPAAQITDLEEKIRKKIEAVSNYRQQIFASRDDVPYATQQQKLDGAEDSLSLPRQVGDAAIAAFFAAQKPRERERLRAELLKQLNSDLKSHGFIELDGAIDKAITKLRAGPKGVHPFHWELEFPEVFTFNQDYEPIGGFDVIVGNPPFLGGTRISTEFTMNYFSWLTMKFPPAGHLCDLVAYFFRNCFNLLRIRGCLGLIATNTIAQGDTREGGLAPILRQGGTIYSAIRRLRWPGEAAVVVSWLHICKGDKPMEATLDGKRVRRVSAFLLEGETDESPARLSAVPYFSLGSKIYGQGFLFDDSDPEANQLNLLDSILEREPDAAERIFSYIGGEDVNGSPTHSSLRKVIYLSDLKTEEELKQFPLLAAVVKAKVKPERDKLGNNPNNVPLKKRWWAYQAHRPELYGRVRLLSRVLVNSQISGHLAFAFVPSDWIYSHALNVFVISDFSGFGLLQSRVHEAWARFLASSMKDDLRYTPSDCFETFPFPIPYESNTSLERAGEVYYDFRADLMIRNNEGLTKTYNRFQDPNEDSADIQRLRELHDAMDRAVLDAYGWQDIQPVCEFFPEFDDEEEEDENGRPKRKKYRYRWPEAIHDEVLARLLELNRQRAEEEKKEFEDVPVTWDAVSDSAPAKPKRTRGKNGAKGATIVDKPSLFTSEAQKD